MDKYWIKDLNDPHSTRSLFIYFNEYETMCYKYANLIFNGQKLDALNKLNGQ